MLGKEATFANEMLNHWESWTYSSVILLKVSIEKVQLGGRGDLLLWSPVAGRSCPAPHTELDYLASFCHGAFPKMGAFGQTGVGHLAPIRLFLKTAIFSMLKNNDFCFQVGIKSTKAAILCTLSWE